MTTRFTKTIAAALALLLLPACGAAEDPQAQESDYIGAAPGEELGISEAADDVFSLNYDSTQSLNPYATDNMSNILISQLVCLNVFDLDENYNLTSRVLESWEVSSNGAYWTFKVKSGIPMHDGSTLTAYDVAYSISLARRTSRYSGRCWCF